MDYEVKIIKVKEIKVVVCISIAFISFFEKRMFYLLNIKLKNYLFYIQLVLFNNNYLYMKCIFRK